MLSRTIHHPCRSTSRVFSSHMQRVTRIFSSGGRNIGNNTSTTTTSNSSTMTTARFYQHRTFSTPPPPPPQSQPLKNTATTPSSSSSRAAAAAAAGGGGGGGPPERDQFMKNRGPVSWMSLFLVGVAAASVTAYYKLERERRLETAMRKVVSSESDGWSPNPEVLAKRKFKRTPWGWFPEEDAFGAG